MPTSNVFQVSGRGTVKGKRCNEIAQAHRQLHTKAAMPNKLNLECDGVEQFIARDFGEIDSG